MVVGFVSEVYSRGRRRLCRCPTYPILADASPLPRFFQPVPHGLNLSLIDTE